MFTCGEEKLLYQVPGESAAAAGRQLCHLEAGLREKITLSLFLVLFARFPSDCQAGNAWGR